MEQKGRIGAFGARRSINAYGDEDLSWVILRHIMTCFFCSLFLSLLTIRLYDWRDAF